MRVSSLRFLPLACCLLLVPLLNCTAQRAAEGITFRSGEFIIVGDLTFPAGTGPFPVVLFVHGDGPNNRTSGVTYPPIMERMHRAGYATFAWDKPGTGESRGMLDPSRVLEQRARIVLDAIEVMKGRPDIDPRRIGMWGISQAGYVMPMVLERTDDVAFMIAISCAGGPGVEQGIYLLASQMVCAGHPTKDVDQLRQQIRAFTMARTWEEHVRYKAPLIDMPAFQAMAAFGQRVELGSERDWHPADPKRPYYGYDPMDMIAKTTIPVLAVFGGRDTQVDPIQGAKAYRAALDEGGNPHSRVELIPGTDHNILNSETGCIAERERRPRAGWRNYPVEYLDVIQRWLEGLES